MGGYDSDTSDEDDYTETNVLLGYASKDPGEANEIISKIGGTPDFFAPPTATTSTEPDFSLFKCVSCSGPTVQLLQLNAELPARFPSHERRLWVVMCPSKSCRRKDGCVRAVRGVRIDRAAVLEQERKVKEEAERKKAENERRKREEEKGKKTMIGTGGGAGGAGGAGMGEFLFGVKGGFGKSGSANPFAPKTPTADTRTAAQDKPSEEAETDEQKTDTKSESTPAPTSTTIPSLTQSFSSALQLNLSPSSPPPSAPTPWPPKTTLPPPFPTLYLSDADYEALDPTPRPLPPQSISIDSSSDPSSRTGGGGGGGGGKEDKDPYESAMDASFQHFADRVGQNPEQVIRYEFGGLPLLYSTTDSVGKTLAKSETTGAKAVSAAEATPHLHGVPRCGNCGAARVFEVQLTPHAIAELEGESLSLDGMDWGTIIVAVCERDCLPPRSVVKGDFGETDEVGYLSEWVGVQWEDLGT